MKFGCRDETIFHSQTETCWYIDYCAKLEPVRIEFSTFEVDVYLHWASYAFVQRRNTLSESFCKYISKTKIVTKIEILPIEIQKYLDMENQVIAKRKFYSRYRNDGYKTIAMHSTRISRSSEPDTLLINGSCDPSTVFNFKQYPTVAVTFTREWRPEAWSLKRKSIRPILLLRVTYEASRTRFELFAVSIRSPQFIVYNNRTSADCLRVTEPILWSRLIHRFDLPCRVCTCNVTPRRIVVADKTGLNFFNKRTDLADDHGARFWIYIFRFTVRMLLNDTRHRWNDFSE